MKKFLVPVCLLLFFSASAQLTTDDVNLIQSMYGKDKRDLMQEYLTFKDSASAHKFWTLYDKYEADRKKLGQEFLSILQDYANNYETLDDAKADKLVSRMSANNIAYENLYSKYYSQMKAAVGALRASQFLQMEAYLRNVIRIAVLDEIPFIGQIDRTHLPAPKQ